MSVIISCTFIIHVCCFTRYTDFFLCLSAKFYKSLFWVPIWLLGVPIGSLFHKKLGPYFKAWWGSLLVLVTVLYRFPSKYVEFRYVRRHIVGIFCELGWADCSDNEPCVLNISVYFNRYSRYLYKLGKNASLMIWSHDSASTIFLGEQIPVKKKIIPVKKKNRFLWRK